MESRLPPWDGVKIISSLCSQCRGYVPDLVLFGGVESRLRLWAFFVIKCNRGWDSPQTHPAHYLARLKAQGGVMGFHKKHPGSGNTLIIEPVGWGSSI